MDVGKHQDSGTLSEKIIQIAAGESHTLALTGDGSVYSWGRGMFGRLGTGSEADELIPTRVKFELDKNGGKIDKVKIVGIAAGSYHSLALADDGSVWSWGYNSYGQLGFEGENSSLPHLVEGFHDLESTDSATDGSAKPSLKISSVKAGGMMSLAIDDLGALWMWGNYPQSIEGSEAEVLHSSSSTPKPVREFHGHTVVKVACGNEHVVALVSSCETHNGGDLICYSWGINRKGQLGLGDKETRFSPEVIETFNIESPWAVYDVACGGSHTAVLAYKKSSSDKSESVCWTFGLGDNGQLGQGTTQSALFPKPVKDLPNNVFLISVDCGLFHTSVVSSAGDVWAWGMEKGYGLCPDATFTSTDAGDALYPRLISCTELYGPRFPEPVQIVCGAAHTILAAAGGYKLWSWGRGQSGLLGNGNTINCMDPSTVLWPPLGNHDEEEIPVNGSGDKQSILKDQYDTEDKRRLSAALEEMKLLQMKLSTMEKYTSILHGSVFGKPFREQDIPITLQNTGTFDIAREWENMLESSDHAKLARLETFYRSMLADIKDKLMKKRIKEIIKECLDERRQL
ncbi:ultraviolet-B receptor UVR8 [Heracleum sosnowskyi]|uniref:Ultraviolet-B receptor UVR8 n=1 Tax=Heracleum sosnowskyi TaxID=360622 RepID=A0AAD8HPL0_9APIA|nr:ultraviolet-B receptor UVR8 [Heracleum sosnowskyi]